MRFCWGDDALRAEFYQRLADFSKTFAMALSTEQFIMNTPEEKLTRYRNDLKRFHNLKASVKLRYAESIDYRDYEPRIKKLLDTHIQANEVVQLNYPVNIFDEKMFGQVKEEQSVYGKENNRRPRPMLLHMLQRRPLPRRWKRTLLFMKIFQNSSSRPLMNTGTNEFLILNT